MTLCSCFNGPGMVAETIAEIVHVQILDTHEQNLNNVRSYGLQSGL